MTKSIPYRPLPKIVAKGTAVPQENKLTVGDRVNIQIIPRNIMEKPFWRLYEVTVIDGDTCRLVTPDKQHAMNAETALVKELRDLQRRLARK